MRVDACRSCTAFAGSERLASGSPEEVALAARAAVDDGRAIVIFDDATALPVEVDLRGSAEDVLRRLPAGAQPGAASVEPAPSPAGRGPGRPRLGVVGREVTLLPRHWEWLNAQPGGASVALRKLVEQARRDYAGKDRVRRSQEAAFRFMSAVAGNEPGFEEAARALFAANAERFEEHAAAWPGDVRAYARQLAADAFAGEGAATRKGGA